MQIDDPEVLALFDLVNPEISGRDHLSVPQIMVV
jgi:hypothetical protein